jgi:hypothetical protein
VIGHRGDSGEFPEHSELAYRAAINHGEAASRGYAGILSPGFGM